MPLTPFQKDVLHLIAGNRRPDSHVAGGAVINRAESRFRISDDIDIFHDLPQDSRQASYFLAAIADADVASLKAAGLFVDWVTRTEHLQQAIVSRGNDSVRLDWVADSAFRFFPVEPDEVFGYRLHDADLATNKVLALAGRTEIRGYIDVLQIDKDYLSLGALIWAACGKDEGFTPGLMLGHANRHTRYTEADLSTQHLVRPIDLQHLKKQWIEAKERAEDLFDRLPPHELGCLYLDHQSRPVTPDPSSPEFPSLVRHRGSRGGALPRIS